MPQIFSEVMRSKINSRSRYKPLGDTGKKYWLIQNSDEI